MSTTTPTEARTTESAQPNDHPATAGRSFGSGLRSIAWTILALHLTGTALLIWGATTGNAAVLPLALVAYGRGVMHAFDFDHVSMIDNSIRKFMAEGKRPVGVGFAFSAGHSTIVFISSLLVVCGSAFARALVSRDSHITEILGIIGVAVTATYLLLVALANVGPFTRAVTAYRTGNPDPAAAGGLSGPATRVLAAPLRRVKHSGHIFGIGILFSMGFDSSAQIGLLLLTGTTVLGGASPVVMMALPVLFAAGMTMTDSANNVVMLRIYESAQRGAVTGRLRLNIAVTGLSILSGLVVTTAAVAELLRTFLPDAGPVVEAVANTDALIAGLTLTATLISVGLFVRLVRKRRSGATLSGALPR